jgi:Uma2 family endonuclease
VCEERVGQLIKSRVEGSPDMTIEILSPSNANYDLIQKKEIYEKYGVKEYIIFDPIAKNASLYALKDGVYYLHQKAGENELLSSLVLPGFSFDLSYIFK